MEGQAKVGDYGTLKMFLIIVLAVIVGSTVFHWGSETAQEVRRKRHIAANPLGTVQTAPVAQVTAATHPESNTVLAGAMGTLYANP